MQCGSCNNAITPGMEIALARTGAPPRHCPYCLHVLSDVPTNGNQRPETAATNVSVERFERRRQVREQFVDRLLRSSSDGALHCPVCDHRLNKNDELMLRNGEHFRCHHCARDLAHVAYREFAYDESHWLPVISAMADLESQPRCADCAYLGAVAKACEQALSCIPNSLPTQHKLVSAVLARTSWALPDCDWSNACIAVQQYRKRAADGIALL